jgi:protein arginine kinase
MLHLPALKLTGEIEKVFRAAKDMRLAVRGLYGEGTEATGDFLSDQQSDDTWQDRRRHHLRLQAPGDPEDHRLRAPRAPHAVERSERSRWTTRSIRALGLLRSRDCWRAKKSCSS